MIVLDTNVISALMLTVPDKFIVAWLNQQHAGTIWTTSVSLFEIHFGIALMAKGKRREILEAAIEQALVEDFDGRVLDFDDLAAREAARIFAMLQKQGTPVDVRDVQIAGIIKARSATLATRNTKHFLNTGIKLVNPWEE